MPRSGFLRKMSVLWTSPEEPVAYSLRLGEEEIPLNGLIGAKIRLAFTGKMKCVACGRDIKKTFQQGYCFPCTQKLAETDFCIVRPELCHHHLGTCRDDAFATRHCFIPHVVYLALSSGVKVGITRAHQKITRWADQGAVAAVELAQVPDRRTAGLLEVEIAKHVPDKTNWRVLLQGDPPEADLLSLKKEIAGKIPADFRKHVTDSQEITRLKYPVRTYPVKIHSYNFDKNPLIDDTLTGIKGQYLLFAHGVINLRKYQGYGVEWA